jgi:hypothetical protein
VHPETHVGRRAAQFFANRSRLADEAAQSADIERDRAIAVRFDTRRKITRELNQ